MEDVEIITAVLFGFSREHGGCSDIMYCRGVSQTVSHRTTKKCLWFDKVDSYILAQPMMK